MAPPARADSNFRSGGGARCAAWLYRPHGPGPDPCVVMGHGFSAVREHRLDAYAERFAEAGLAALVFDYRHFGASEGEPRQLLSIARQLEDWRAAVAHARSLEGIDTKRIALWGSSFGGGHAIAIAAKDPDVAAVVSQVPYTDGPSALLANSPATGVRFTVAGIRDLASAVFGRQPHYIPAVGPPGTLAVMTAADAEPGFRAMDPPESTWVNRVAARVMLSVPLYRPYAKFAKLRMPVLVQTCDGDTTTPPGPAVRAAERSPNAELIRYPIGHFEIYVDPQFQRTIADQTEFLTRNLLPTPAAPPARPADPRVPAQGSP